MLNYLWAFMILIGIIYGAIHGTMPEITNAALDSAKEAVTLCITMLGVMAFWSGLMEIARDAGIIANLTKGIQPFINFMFPRLPREHKAREHIATNMIANILGLGWGATPAGLRAMKEFANLEAERGNPAYIGDSVRGRIASNEMCTFLILNISSLQLIPVNIIAYRSQYGSVNPAAVIGPSIVATAVSTLVAVVYCKCKDRKR